MADFTPERLYVSLGNTGPKRRERVAEAVIKTGASLAIEPHTTILNGLKRQLVEAKTYRFKDVFIDTHLHELPEYTSASIDLLRKLPSIGYISIDARDSEASIENAARFNDGLQVVMKGIDTDSTEEEHIRRFNQSIGETTKSFVETAQKFGINYLMVAGVDIEHVENVRGAFVSGIRPSEKIPELGVFHDRSNYRSADPIDVLNRASVPVNLVVSRQITMAPYPDQAIEAIVERINQG